MKNVVILHDFDGKPYFRALERVTCVTYLNTRPFRFIIRDLIKYKRIKRETLASLFFLLKLPFVKNKTFLLGMAPYNYRIIFYGFLSWKNKVILHTSWHQWNDVVPFEYPQLFKRGLKRVWRYFLSRFIAIVAVTAEAKKSLSQLFPELTDRITIIHHVVDIQPISMPELELKWRGKHDTFLFTGRLTHAKGVDTFLKLAQYACDSESAASFIVAGKGELAGDVQRYSSEHRNLDYYGYISEREKLKKIMACSHFFLLPSRKINGWEELFGLVVIEAMSQGCLVIASDHIGPMEIITSCQDGFIVNEEGFYSEVKSIIDTISTNNSLYYSQAMRAVATSNSYTIELVARKWDSLLNSL